MCFFIFLLLFFRLYIILKTEALNMGVFGMIKRLAKQQEIESGYINIKKKHIYGNFSTHWHEFFEAEFILSGSGKYIIDGKEYDIKKGMLFLMSPINFHELKDSDAEIINLKFSDSICSRSVLFPITGGTVENAIEFSGKSYELLACLFEELLSAKNDAVYASSILDCLLLKAVRSSKNPDKSQLTYVRSAMLYLLNNFRSAPTLSDAAAHVGLSPAYLSSIFSSETGTGFKEYLNSIRFEYAKKLLMYSDMSISEVCYESGFDDYSNFLRGFKERFAETPMQFKKSRI